MLANAYIKPGKTLIALASWAPEKVEVRLQVNWQAFGLDAAKAHLLAPEIKDFQPARKRCPNDPIPLELKHGWLM